MATITENLQIIKNSMLAIKQAIIDRGGTIDGDITTWANSIVNIPHDPPSLSTAALYEVINYQHEGTIEDPIPYVPPMEIFNGKYYIQNDIKYLCNRDSGAALSHDLSALVGVYVELV